MLADQVHHEVVALGRDVARDGVVGLDDEPPPLAALSLVSTIVFSSSIVPLAQVSASRLPQKAIRWP